MQPETLCQKYHVSRETVLQLSRYVKLLLQWQSKINLIGAMPEEEIWHRHIEDSLQLHFYLPDKDVQIMDMGSGAGLPAIVLSVLGYRVMAVESDQRKAAFLRHAAAELKLSIDIAAKRAESVDCKTDVVTARALAPLTQLLKLSAVKLKPNGYCVFPKGEKWNTEIEEASSFWEFEYEAKNSMTHAEAKILIIKNISKKAGT
jgi:16S rRNA (guanine527-N7)-methyltransferase